MATKSIKLPILFIAFILAMSSYLFLFEISAAHAHSELLSTTPTPGQNFDETPKEIRLEFNTDIETFPTSIRIYDENAKRVNVQNRVIEQGNEVRTELERLDPGRYIVTWNVVSPDAHPLRGAFSFVINEQEPTKEDSTADFDSTTSDQDSDEVDAILKSQEQSTLTRISTYVANTFVFVSLSIIIAIVLLHLLVLKIESSKKVDKYIRYASFICIFATLLSVLMHVSSAQGLSLFESFSFSALSYGFQSVFGIVGLLRIVCILALLFIWKKQDSRFIRYFLILLALGLAFTPALSGHSRVGDFALVATLLSAVHILAISIWFGGLILIAGTIKKGFPLEKIKRFSNVALLCVFAIVISGLFASWRQVGSIEASQQTWFGQLLSLKVLLFLAVVLIGVFSRIYTSSLIKNDGSQLRSQIRNFVIAEIILILAIYSVSSVLVNTIPAKQAYSLPATISSTTELATFEFIIDPPKPGRTEVHIYILDIKGTPMQLERSDRRLDQEIISVTMENKEAGIGPIEVPMRFLGFNHFSSIVEVPESGQWTIDARLNITDTNQVETSIEVDF